MAKASNSVVDTQTGEIIDFSAIADDQWTTHSDLESLSEMVGGFSDAHDFMLQVADKADLINRPFYMVKWQTHESTRFTNSEGEPASFASILCCTVADKKVTGYFVVNDGSTGIARQLVTLETHTGKRGGIFCPKGLKVQEYTTEDERGNEIQATTYYIA
ncbi:MAG: hypothetical protein ACREHG_10245 [Candidatus Saccharimonadales bacterium]